MSYVTGCPVVVTSLSLGWTSGCGFTYRRQARSRVNVRQCNRPVRHMVAADGPHGFVPTNSYPKSSWPPQWCPVVTTYRLISLEELDIGNGPALGAYRTSQSCIGVALDPVLSTCPSLLWSYFHAHLPTIVYFLLLIRHSLDRKPECPCLQSIVGARQCGEWTLVRLTTWTGKLWDPSLT
jgi:hypothetical protein